MTVEPAPVVLPPSTALSATTTTALSVTRAATPALSPRSWPKWLATGSSTAMLAVGSYVVYKGYAVCTWGHPGCTSDRAYNVIGYTAIDAGVAFGALSLYWFYDLTLDKLPAKWLVIGGTAAVAVGAGLYAFDQDPGHTDLHGDVTKYYWDLAPPGVALGVAGLASIGVGVWYRIRGAHASLLPTVSMSSSRTIVGWAGQF